DSHPYSAPIGPRGYNVSDDPGLCPAGSPGPGDAARFRAPSVLHHDWMEGTMRRLMTLLVPLAGTIVSVAVLAPPALANTQVKTVNHVNFTYVEKQVCPFHLSVHLEGSYKSVDYYDGRGSFYKRVHTSGERR